MKDYQSLPKRIKDAVESKLSEKEKIKFFFLAGKPMFSSPDYVFITDKRLLTIDIRTIGHLTSSYVNVKTNLLLSEVKSVKLERSLKCKIFGQANLQIDVEGYKYLINGANFKSAKQALELILSGMQNF